MIGIEALPEHNVLVLLAQLGVVLFFARLGGAAMSRLGQPAVLGEILAGIALGPSLFGGLAPALHGSLFPREALSFHLLEGVAWIGMILLVFLVGLEVDLKVLRRVGKPAVIIMASTLGACLSVGLGLGIVLPEHLAGPAGRPVVLASFMGLTASVVAVPILAKILLDLNLLQRDLSMAAIGAALAADIALWTGLSVVLDMAHAGKASPMAVAKSLGGCAFVLAAALGPGRPAVRWLFKKVDENLDLPHRRVTLAAVLAFSLAAATHAMGVHAVFGAFIAGLIAGDAARFKHEDREVVDALTNGMLSPVFFSYAGLLVDLRSLAEWGLVGVLVGAWTAAKLSGGYVGARVGGFRVGESLAIGVSLNSGGAMTIVVALLGLSAGIVNAELYSALVAAAVATTLLSPILLRLMAPAIPPSPEELARFERDAREARSAFKKGDLKALLPTAGGASSSPMLALLAPMAAAKRVELSVFMVREPGKSIRERVMRVLGWDPETLDFQAAADSIKKRAEGFGLPLTPRVVTRRDRAQAVLEEAERGHSLLLLGAHSPADPLGGDFLAEVVADSPCHVGLLRGVGTEAAGAFKNILLPTKGDPLFPFVLEFASLYAETVPGCRITVLHVQTERKSSWSSFSRLLSGAEDGSPAPRAGAMASLVAETLQEHTSAAGGAGVDVEQKSVKADRASTAILREVGAGGYDLVMLAGVKSLVRERLFFGNTIQELLRRASCPVLVLTPKGGRAPAAR